jgi:hypothetical protein
MGDQTRNKPGALGFVKKMNTAATATTERRKYVGFRRSFLLQHASRTGTKRATTETNTEGENRERAASGMQYKRQRSARWRYTALPLCRLER